MILTWKINKIVYNFLVLIAMNEKWHKDNPMPKNPTEYQRAEWHIKHQENCGCRPIPKNVLDYIKKGKKMPK